MSRSQNPTWAEVLETLNRVARGDGNCADLIDRIQASTRHPEPVVELAGARDGRRRAGHAIQFMDALGRSMDAAGPKQTVGEE